MIFKKQFQAYNALINYIFLLHFVSIKQKLMNKKLIIIVINVNKKIAQ